MIPRTAPIVRTTAAMTTQRMILMIIPILRATAEVIVLPMTAVTALRMIPTITRILPITAATALRMILLPTVPILPTTAATALRMTPMTTAPMTVEAVPKVLLPCVTRLYPMQSPSQVTWHTYGAVPA